MVTRTSLATWARTRLPFSNSTVNIALGWGAMTRPSSSRAPCRPGIMLLPLYPAKTRITYRQYAFCATGGTKRQLYHNGLLFVQSHIAHFGHPVLIPTGTAKRRVILM